MLLDIPLDRITEEQITALIGTAEDRQIEFKGELPRGDRESVIEFLKDVSAMANASGGDVI